MELYSIFYYDLTSNVKDEVHAFWRSPLTEKDAVKAEIESKENWSVTFIERLS